MDINWRKLSMPHIMYDGVQKERDLKEDLGFSRDVLPTELGMRGFLETWKIRISTMGHVIGVVAVEAALVGAAIGIGSEIIETIS